MDEMDTKSQKGQKRKIIKKADSKDKKIIKKPKKETIQATNSESEINWDVPKKLSELKNVNINISLDLVKMFEAGDTIPFIARYRKSVTNDMDPEVLRDVKDCYVELCACKKKAEKIINTIKKEGLLTSEIVNSISQSHTNEELEFIFEPFKPGKQKTLVEKAKELGLLEHALAILKRQRVNIQQLINVRTDGLKTREEVENGILNIISHEISTTADTLEFVQNLRKDLKLILESKLKSKTTEDTNGKYQLYYNFKIPVPYLKPHQVLALNRGEKQKILTIKITVPDYALHKFNSYCFQKYSVLSEHCTLFKNSVADAYKRRIQPLLIRKARAELNSKADISAIETFALNLKNLLLTTPTKGKVILSIDPGFKVGCKVGIISRSGDVLDTTVIYPNVGNKNSDDPLKIKNLLEKYDCKLIAIGNGTACRETEIWLSNLIKNKYFSSELKYTIVDECGASIYSCSAEAKKEFPDLDPLYISAISLARRIQDPLSELVKIEPQHLGVGMYQHDVNKKILENTLNEIVSECASFIGVDLNTASQCLLRRVAGLTDLRAKNIIEYRTKNGPFLNREEIKKVKGVGDKTFEQCAGFLKISPINSTDIGDFYKQKNTNPLDCTIIHPESYHLAKTILQKYKSSIKDIGTIDFINNFAKQVANISPKLLAEELNSSESTISLILDALKKPLDYDLRNDNNLKPVFRSEITSATDLSVNMTLNGHVRNVTTFGAFVDLGVGINGLIHKSHMNGFDPQLGCKVVVKILNLDIDRERIGLEIVNVI